MADLEQMLITAFESVRQNLHVIRLDIYRLHCAVVELHKGSHMSGSLSDQLVAEVTATVGVEDSAEKAFAAVIAELEAADGTGDAAKITQAIADLKAKRTELAAAIAAQPGSGTTAPPSTTQPAPASGGDDDKSDE